MGKKGKPEKRAGEKGKEASKERKTVEKLREKKWLKFTEAIEKAEQHFIDEIALAKFHSKKSRGDQCIP